MSKLVRKRALVSGLVQGVNFRSYTRSAARHAGVAGWVRNLPDGRVEVLMEGEAERVETLLAWLYKGSPYGRVDHVEVFAERATGEFTDFAVTYTGGNRW